MRVTGVADRGFGRTELARTCQHLGSSYVTRIQPDVYVQCSTFCGRIGRLRVKCGTERPLCDVPFREHHPVRQHVAIYWKKGLPKDRDECWFLMADLPYRGKKLATLYDRRMAIEAADDDRGTVPRRAEPWPRLGVAPSSAKRVACRAGGDEPGGPFLGRGRVSRRWPRYGPRRALFSNRRNRSGPASPGGMFCRQIGSYKRVKSPSIQTVPLPRIDPRITGCSCRVRLPPA